MYMVLTDETSQLPYDMPRHPLAHHLEAYHPLEQLLQAQAITLQHLPRPLVLALEHPQDPLLPARLFLLFLDPTRRTLEDIAVMESFQSGHPRPLLSPLGPLEELKRCPCQSLRYMS
jgi:hypothetical protein